MDNKDTREELLEQIKTLKARISELEQKVAGEGEKRLREILEQVPDPVLVHDMHGRFLDANQEACKSLGYTKEELLRLGVSDIDPEAMAGGRARLWEDVVKGKRFTFESQHKRKDDSTYPVEVALGPIELGQETLVLGIIRDISVRKRAVEELRMSKKEIEELVETANSIIIRWKTDGTLVFINSFGARIFGYNKEELIGRNVMVLVPEVESTGRDLSSLAEDIAAHPERYAVNENENIKKNGERFWVVWTNKAIQDEKGAIKEILAIGNDVTAKKLVEEKARELTGQIEFVLGTTKTNLDIIDEDFNLVYVDPLWEKIYGDYHGRKCYEYFAGSKKECPSCAVRVALKTKETVISEELLPREGNRPIQITTAPFQGAGGKWFVAEVNVDITTLKKKETDLKEKLRQLQVFNKTSVERELMMATLKERIRELERRLAERG